MNVDIALQLTSNAIDRRIVHGLGHLAFPPGIEQPSCPAVARGIWRFGGGALRSGTNRPQAARSLAGRGGTTRRSSGGLELARGDPVLAQEAIEATAVLAGEARGETDVTAGAHEQL